MSEQKQRAYEELSPYWQKQTDFAQWFLKCDRAKALQVTNNYLNADINMGSVRDWSWYEDVPPVEPKG